MVLLSIIILAGGCNRLEFNEILTFRCVELG